MESKGLKYNTYPAYKESGVEWLGKIPEGWRVVPGLAFLYENKEKNAGMISSTLTD